LRICGRDVDIWRNVGVVLLAHSNLDLRKSAWQWTWWHCNSWCVGTCSMLVVPEIVRQVAVPSTLDKRFVIGTPSKTSSQLSVCEQNWVVPGQEQFPDVQPQHELLA
jgi:hypothetical protein